MTHATALRVLTLRTQRATTSPVRPAHTPQATAAAMAVTAIRLPIGAFGIWMITASQPITAAISFTLVAIVDLLDGIAARAVGKDTAARRISDVVLDRVLIHGAALAACAAYDSGWMLWAPLLARDAAQGILSLTRVVQHGVVVVGAHWHMSYGLAMLAWGCEFILSGQPNSALTFATYAISAATLIDYERGLRAILTKRQVRSLP
jgi:phosphatidylglycerophosphate synthase